MQIGLYGRLFVLRLIGHLGSISRSDLINIVETNPELGICLGRQVSADSFLRWCTEKGAVCEESGTLELTALGQNVLESLDSRHFNDLLARVLLNRVCLRLTSAKN